MYFKNDNSRSKGGIAVKSLPDFSEYLDSIPSTNMMTYEYLQPYF